MADLGVEIEVGPAWVNITSAASMQNGKTYLLDRVIEKYPNVPLMYWARTDNNTAPTIAGHAWPTDGNSPQGEEKQKANQVFWLRSLGGMARVAVTEA